MYSCALLLLRMCSSKPDSFPRIRMSSTHSWSIRGAFWMPVSQNTQIFLGSALQGSLVWLTKGFSGLSMMN